MFQKSTCVGSSDLQREDVKSRISMLVRCHSPPGACIPGTNRLQFPLDSAILTILKRLA
jgi:hypothetical protein